MGKTAILAGGSGLVGHHVLNLLLQEQDYERVIALVRRKLPFSHPKLEQRIVSFDEIGNADLKGDDIYCCLGTTIRTAGSQEAFRKVDFTYIVNLAQSARRQGARKFLLVSSLGADARSKVFYTRTKGETEDAVRKIGFEETHAFRPSILVGDRREFRAAEKLGIALGKLAAPAMFGPLRKYRPIRALDVAQAMVLAARPTRPGYHVHESDAIQAACVFVSEGGF